MKLSEILKQVIKEDAWGTNPAAAGSMSPGTTPNAVSPSPSPSKVYDLSTDFRNFTTKVDQQEEAASKALEQKVGLQVKNKKVSARASKGSVGQVEKDYTIDVASVDVSYMNDKFYVVLKGTDDSEYYINTDPIHKIKVLGTAEKKKSSSSSQPKPPQAIGKGQVGGIAYPQNMGLSTNSNTGAM